MTAVHGARAGGRRNSRTGADTALRGGVNRLGCLSSSWQSPGGARERSGDGPASLPSCGCEAAVAGRVPRAVHSDPQVRDGPAVQLGDGKCHRITAGLLREARLRSVTAGDLAPIYADSTCQDRPVAARIQRLSGRWLRPLIVQRQPDRRPAHRPHRRSMLPVKESGAIRIRIEGWCLLPCASLAARRRAGGRQPEPVPDGLLDLLLGWP
jgi:hypothetical protein